MPRSVAELLPRPFEDLTIEDVRSIISAARGEGESLWLEWKERVTTSSLAKACSAFANAYGGLLVVGVSNDGTQFPGTDPLAAEAQLWVKDTLREHVLPLPPFRARWIAGSHGKGFLLVLVEESSTTPHLLVRSGAVYVRNPGSSDPVPINDQGRLLDLTNRGQSALRLAANRAEAISKIWLHDSTDLRTESLAIAATGASAGFADRLFSSADVPTLISDRAWGTIPPGSRVQEWRQPHWMQDFVGAARFQQQFFSSRSGNLIEAAVVHRDAAVCLYRGHTRPASEDRLDSLIESDLRGWFASSLAAARDLLLELGAHGDVRLYYVLLPRNRNIHFDVRPDQVWVQQRAESPLLEVTVPLWTNFDAEVTGRVFEEVARAAGLGPPR